jgi:hypothetical protein
MNKTFMKLRALILKLKSQRIDQIEELIVFCSSFRSKENLLWNDFMSIRQNRNKVYRKFQVKFYKFDPKWLRSHRNYFKQENRGFGEDLFHSYWLSLIETYKPLRLLEIGVYRGQTISLWALIAKKLNMNIEIIGISPLDDSGDDVSSYLKLDYEIDIFRNFEKFNLPKPILIKGLSKEHSDLIKTGMWDLIYIDGSHNYSDVKIDLDLAYFGLKVGGLLVLDDSSLYTDFKPLFSNAFRGHPGPSRVFLEIERNKWKFVMGVGHNNILQKI